MATPTPYGQIIQPNCKLAVGRNLQITDQSRFRPIDMPHATPHTPDFPGIVGVSFELPLPALATPAPHPGWLDQPPATAGHRLSTHGKPSPQGKTRQAPHPPQRRPTPAPGR